MILTSRPEGDAREAAGRFSKTDWDGAIADLPNYLYDETPRAFSRLRNIRLTSKSPRAAIIPAPFASFRSCAGSFAHAV